MTAGQTLDEAVEAVAQGHLVVLPTDTVYGIGARPDLPAATRRLFEAKRRPRDLDLPVLVADKAAAARVADVDARADVLMERFWPGPLTIVLPRSKDSSGWALGSVEDTIGIRQPNHPTALSLLRRTGPLAVTSANLSGHPTPATCDEIRAVFGPSVAVYLCDSEPLVGTASTVVDLTGGEMSVLRVGALPAEDLRAALRD